MRYTVKPGDTLWALAKRFDTTVDELLRLNPQIKDRNRIYAGRELNVPGEKPIEVPRSPIPEPQPLNVKQPILRNPADYQTRPETQPNFVALDEAQAAEGMQTEFGPAEIAAQMALMLPSSVAGLARMMPSPLPRAGIPAMKLSNVAAIQGSQGVAAALKAAGQRQLAEEARQKMPFSEFRDYVLFGQPPAAQATSWQAVLGQNPARRMSAQELADLRERVLFGP